MSNVLGKLGLRTVDARAVGIATAGLALLPILVVVAAAAAATALTGQLA